MTKQMNAPKLRFGEFNTLWSSVKLGDITSYLKGFAFKSEDYLDNGDLDSRLIRVSDLSSDSIKYHNPKVFLSNELTERSNKYKLKDDDILVTTVGSKPELRESAVGRAIYVNEAHGYLNQNLLIMRPNGSHTPNFLFSQLNTPRYISHITNIQRGNANQSNITVVDLFDYRVSSTTLPEQQKIASFLSKVDEKITLLTKKKEKLTEYKKGLMQQLFNGKWEERDGQLTFIPPTLRFKADNGSEFPDWQTFGFYSLLNEVLDFRGRTPLKIGMDWGNGSILSLSANNVKNGYIDRDAENNVGSEELFTKWMGKVNLAKGDIIFTMEAPLGNALLLPDSEKYILSQRVVAFQTKQKLVNNNFLIQVIWGKEFQNTIAKLSTGTTAKGINQKSLKKINVSLPCLKEQTKIADFLSSLDKKIELTDSELEKAKEWKKGLLQQMFV